MKTTLADAIGEKVEELALRFPTHRDRQAVRAYLLASAYQVSMEDIGRMIGELRSVRNLIRSGRILVREAVESQLVSMEEMRAWLKQVRERTTA